MVDFYVMQIQVGNIALDSVPERFKEAVAAKIENKQP